MAGLQKPDWRSSYQQTLQAETDRLLQMRRRIWHGLPKELGDSYRVLMPWGDYMDTSELSDGDIRDVARDHADRYTRRAIAQWAQNEAHRKRRAGVGL